MTATAEAAEAGAPSANRRLSLITVDQVLSSVSNVGALIWVAHTVEPTDFGRFSLIVMVYMVAQVVIRSLVSTVVVVHPEEADARPRAILSSALVVGFGAGLLCGAAGLALLLSGSEFGPPILVFALPLPLLFVHDVARYLGISRQQPMRSVVLDSLWIVLMALGFVALLVADLDALMWPVMAWAWAGGLAALWAFVQYGAPAGHGAAWVREHWGFSWRSLVSGLSASGIMLAASALMTFFSSALAVAGLRAATLLAAPSTAMQMAVATSAATDIARERDDERSYWRHVRKAILIATAVGVVNLLVLVSLPDFVGWALLGDTWDIVEPLMLPIALKVLLMAGQSGLRAALLGRHRIGVTMVTDIVSFVLIGVCMVLGAYYGGVEGALWSMAYGTAASTVCWWVAIVWKGRGPATPVQRRPERVRPGKHARRRSDPEPGQAVRPPSTTST